MAKILIVDDEPRIRDLIREHLQYAGFVCEEAGDGGAALAVLAQGGIDLVILDIMMPFMDGMTCLREMRTRKIMTPVIMLTARSEEYDKLAGLEGGADDYVVKPFMPRELTARIRAVLRRASAEGRARESAVPPADDRQEEIVRCGPLLMNETRFEATADGMPLKLSVKEFRLLLMFASRPGRVFTRGQLLENIWGNSFVDERTVDVHMLRLRKALAGTAAENLIETVRGVGYRCRPLD